MQGQQSKRSSVASGQPGSSNVFSPAPSPAATTVGEGMQGAAQSAAQMGSQTIAQPPALSQTAGTDGEGRGCKSSTVNAAAFRMGSQTTEPVP